MPAMRTSVPGVFARKNARTVQSPTYSQANSVISVSQHAVAMGLGMYSDSVSIADVTEQQMRWKTVMSDKQVRI